MAISLLDVRDPFAPARGRAGRPAAAPGRPSGPSLAGAGRHARGRRPRGGRARPASPGCSPPSTAPPTPSSPPSWSCWPAGSVLSAPPVPPSSTARAAAARRLGLRRARRRRRAAGRGRRDLRCSTAPPATSRCRRWRCWPWPSRSASCCWPARRPPPPGCRPGRRSRERRADPVRAHRLLCGVHARRHRRWPWAASRCSGPGRRHRRARAGRRHRCPDRRARNRVDGAH